MKIEPGIFCKVIGGALMPSPNLNKIVTVVEYVGEHTLHGPVWKCNIDNGITEYGIVGNFMDFAEDWLEPIGKSKLNEFKSDEIAI
jgi:hypothetical protein